MDEPDYEPDYEIYGQKLDGAYRLVCDTPWRDIVPGSLLRMRAPVERGLYDVVFPDGQWTVVVHEEDSVWAARCIDEMCEMLRGVRPDGRGISI